MTGQVAELPHVNWYVVGAVGSLATQAVIGFAALITRPPMPGGGWLWYGLTYGGIVGCYFVVRTLTSAWWRMVWPLFCVLRILTFGQINHPAGQLVTGFITLCFLYVGLTQPQGRSLLLLPLGLLTLFTLIDGPVSGTLVRLFIATLIWTGGAELPCFLLRHLVSREHLLAVAARTDVLTGARNRFGLAETLTRLRGRAFLVIIDLDHFKDYNDSYGHSAGDRVLADFAEMLHQQTRKDDVVVRYGGEEFLVVLADVEQATAESVVARWAAGWREHASAVTFSAGITDLLDDDSISLADTALYSAKAGGRARVVVQTSAAFNATGADPGWA